VATGAASGEVTVVNGRSTPSGHHPADHQPDDIYCNCTPSSATGSASVNNKGAPVSGSAGGLNNNKLSPYLVSAATSPRKKHTRIVMTPSGMHETTKTLPPLDINRTILHHHSTRRSARKSSRGHTVPVMLATKASLNASKRSHSAASNAPEEAVFVNPGTPEPHHIHVGHHGGRRSRGHHRGHASASPERKSAKVLCTPEKMSRRGHILNKIETVRILRARPAFYPFKDKVSGGSKASKSVVREYVVDNGSGLPTSGMATPIGHHDYMELPHNILGKHITLRMDRTEKRKRKGLASLTPSSHLA